MATVTHIGMPRLGAATALLAALAGLFVLATPPDAAEARPRCGGKVATMVGTKGNDVLRARTNGRDVIVARGGNDRIFSQRGRDVVCAGPGNDRVYAGQGRDRVLGGGGSDFMHGGMGKDKLVGQGGADVAIGASGGDLLRGGGGNDRIFGGIQDDKLWGGSGSDTLIGSQGIDLLDGAGGNDWLRGDTNGDVHRGGSGSDTVSYATATPPGPNPETPGVIANLTRGWARGDDTDERLSSVENAVGSAFADELLASGWVVDGLGPIVCDGLLDLLCRGSGGSPTSSTASVEGLGTPDPGVVLYGDDGSDSWKVVGGSGGVRIYGSGLDAGPGCSAGSGSVYCRVSSSALGYVLAWGSGGNDSITIGGGLPETAVIKVDGGPGSDVLAGSKFPDLLYSGESGADRLYGRGGDDALTSRAGGADRLYGGPGNDNLVTNAPCSPHLYSGGPGGGDVAGFGHVTSRGVAARIGGRGRLRGHGCAGTRILRNNEVLEGSMRADVLQASRRRDLLIGRAGRDRCIGGRHKRC